MSDSPWTPGVEFYFTQLGEFMTAYAEMEQSLLLLLEHLAGVKPQVARAIFSGVRTETATGHVTRLLEVLKYSVDDRLAFQAIFSQIGHINQLRNDIVHYGTKFNGPGPDFWVTNKRAALNRTRLRTINVSSHTLIAMRGDVETIIARIYLFLSRYLPPEKLMVDLDGARLYAQRAWLYKPALPTSQDGKRRSKPQKRQRPRRPSRGSP